MLSCMRHFTICLVGTGHSFLILSFKENISFLLALSLIAYIGFSDSRGGGSFMSVILLVWYVAKSLSHSSSGIANTVSRGATGVRAQFLKTLGRVLEGRKQGGEEKGRKDLYLPAHSLFCLWGGVLFSP